MKRSGLLGIVLLFLAFVLVGCGATTVNVNEIDIDAVDQIDIPAGTYTVEYTIEDLSDLVKNYNATVVIVAHNKAGQEVTVSGNTFTVEANEEYTVTIRLTIGEEFKEKTITVKAITIIETTVDVSFDLAGGVGSFPVQTVTIGGFAVRPTTEPTKADHLFLGWFGSQADTVSFDFEHMMIYTDTVLTARWEEVVSDQRKITYDLNGAIQTEEWFELVLQGNLASGPIVNPIRQGHLFQGWAYDEDGLTMFDFATTTIQTNLTLYAVWHVDFDVIVDAEAFDGARAIHAFDLVEGNVLQQYELYANVLLSTLGKRSRSRGRPR
ncbi:MAG: InlB B-repeat-containing protein [Bacillus subtilis]|nr:InlB B-repeat-containing protein [Bacillus subtilis]